MHVRVYVNCVVWIAVVFNVFDQMDASSHSVADENAEVSKGDDAESADSPLGEDSGKMFNNEDTRRPINVDRFKYFDNTSDEMTSSSVLIGGQIRKRSPVWKYFVYRQTCALCKLCRKSLKRSSGCTSNLSQHLKRAHRKQYRALMEEYSRRKEEAEARDEVCYQTLD